MNIIQLLTFTACIALGVSCGNNLQNKTHDNENQVDTAHTSENSLDWDGVYIGQLPCADCEGIETTITLNSDKTFKIVSHYLGKEDSSFESLGTFEWDKSGSIITLDQTQYKVGENILIQLDNQGHEISGALTNSYILNKTPSAIVGNDMDEHGCIGSAGYTWSKLRNECIKIWEIGKRLVSLDNEENSAIVVFNNTKSKVEIYFSNHEDTVILPLKGNNYESKKYSFNNESSILKIEGVVKYN